MKKVQFLRPLPPIMTGEARILPDGMASKLVEAGTVRIVTSVFDKTASTEREKPQQPTSHEQVKYQTRNGKAHVR